MEQEQYLKQFDYAAERTFSIDPDVKNELREELKKALESINKQESFEISKPIYNSELPRLEFEMLKMSDGRAAWWYTNSTGAEMFLGDQETAAKTITHWFFLDKLFWLNMFAQRGCEGLGVAL